MSDRMRAVYRYKSNEAIWCITRILDMNVVESGVIIDTDYSTQPHRYVIELDSQGEQIVMTSGQIAYTSKELKERISHTDKGGSDCEKEPEIKDKKTATLDWLVL